MHRAPKHIDEKTWGKNVYRRVTLISIHDFKNVKEIPLMC